MRELLGPRAECLVLVFVVFLFRTVLKSNATQACTCTWPAESPVTEAVPRTSHQMCVSDVSALTSTSRAQLSIHIISVFPRSRVNITRHKILDYERSKCQGLHAGNTKSCDGGKGQRNGSAAFGSERAIEWERRQDASQIMSPPSLNSVPREDTRIPRDYFPGNITLYINKTRSKSDHDTFQSHNPKSMQGKGAWFSVKISKTLFLKRCLKDNWSCFLSR